MKCLKLFLTILLLVSALCSCAVKSAETAASAQQTRIPALQETTAREETPPTTEEFSTEEIPAEEVSAGDIPAEEVPTEEIPAEDIPAEEVPVEEVPAKKTPAKKAPAKKQESKLPDYTPDAYALLLLERVNAARTANGLPPLVLDETLCRLAYVRAQEAAVQWSHTRPNGKPCYSVYEEFNIQRIFWTGENLAYYALQDAQLIADSWMESEGHRKNILYPKYTAAGMAVFWSGETYYIANLFRS